MRASCVRRMSTSQAKAKLNQGFITSSPCMPKQRNGFLFCNNLAYTCCSLIRSWRRGRPDSGCKLAEIFNPLHQELPPRQARCGAVIALGFHSGAPLIVAR